MERPFLELKPNKWKSQVNWTALSSVQHLTKVSEEELQSQQTAVAETLQWVLCKLWEQLEMIALL